MVMKAAAFLLLLLLFQQAGAQNAAPCSAPEVKQFDFWVGDWTATWADTLHGTNHVERIMDGCTVQENFTDPQKKYSGKSWTVYNAALKQWQQTWIDNQGAYIALTGGLVGDSMILTTAERVTPKGTMIARMVFYHITPASFDWSWEASTDSGLTWKPAWQIHYTRRL